MMCEELVKRLKKHLKSKLFLFNFRILIFYKSLLNNRVASIGSKKPLLINAVQSSFPLADQVALLSALEALYIVTKSKI